MGDFKKMTDWRGKLMKESKSVETQNGNYCDICWFDGIMESWISKLERISRDSGTVPNLQAGIIILISQVRQGGSNG